MPTADANGIRIHYEVHGEGRPLLLILGLGGDVSENAALIDQLAVRSRVIAFDNRGAGRTDKPDAPYSIELMAADALGVRDALGVSRADVPGIFLGGRIALELALGHPERVERLIPVSTSAGSSRAGAPAPRSDPLGDAALPEPLPTAPVRIRPPDGGVGRVRRRPASPRADHADGGAARAQRPDGAAPPGRSCTAASPGRGCRPSPAAISS